MTDPVKPKKSSKRAGDVPAPVPSRLDAELTSLAKAVVVKVPWLADERAQHLGGFALAAARDASELCAVALPEGNVEPWEIAALPVALAEVATLAVAVRADQVTAGTGLSADDAKALAETREAQGTVLWAFRRLRYRGVAAKLRELDAIEAGDPDDVVDAHRDSVRIVAIADHDDERAWFAALACGEPEALAVIKKHLPRLDALAVKVKLGESSAARRDRLCRLWTVIGRIERRVRDAADYRYRGTPKRDDYRAFETPWIKKTKAVRAAERPKKLAAKKAAKKAAEAEKKAAKKAKKG